MGLIRVTYEPTVIAWVYICFSLKHSQSELNSKSLFILTADCIEFDFKEISYLVYGFLPVQKWR